VLLQRGNRRSGLTACVAALTFHLSAIFIVPLLFLQSCNRRAVITVSVIVFFISLFGLDLLLNYFQDSIRVVMAHQQAGFGDELPNPLSSGLILDWAMIFIGLLLWERISPPMKHILLIELIGMAIFYSSLDFAVISHRVRELFSVFWILFVAQGLQREPLVKDISILFIVINVALYIYLYFYHINLFL
jgi:hypothetical protein